MNVDNPISWLARGLFLLVIAIIASRKGKEWQRSNPHSLGFTWGYFQGLMLATALPLVCLLVASWLSYRPMVGFGDTPLLLVLGGIGLVGWKMISRRRWAWVFGIFLSGVVWHMLFSSNLALICAWIINSIYTWKRWAEFAQPFGVVGLATKPSEQEQWQWIQHHQFCLEIDPGEKDGMGNVQVEHGQTYCVLLSNHTPRRCDVSLMIDETDSGLFRLEPGETLRLERPVHNTGRFTFFAANSPEGRAAGLKAGSQLGTVKATFMPEECPPETLTAITPLVDNHSKPTFTSNLEKLDQTNVRRTVKLCAARPLTSVNDCIGGTGLTGKSMQTFQDTEELIRVPDSEFVFKSLRLLLKAADSFSTEAPVPSKITIQWREKINSFFKHPIIRFCQGALAIIVLFYLAAVGLKKYHQVTKWDLPRLDHYSQGDIIKRGWTDGMIQDLLGDPDEYAPNPVSRSSGQMRLWSKKRVHEVETTAIFRIKQQQAANRSDRIRKLLESKLSNTDQFPELDIPGTNSAEIVPIVPEPFQAPDHAGPKMRRIPE